MLLCVLCVALLTAVRSGAGPDDKDATKLNAEMVRKLETSFKSEKEAAEKARIPARFSPEWFERADALARAGRTDEARDAYAEALARFEAKGIVPAVERVRSDLAGLP